MFVFWIYGCYKVVGQRWLCTPFLCRECNFGLPDVSLLQEDEVTPYALRRKVVSPGDKTRPFGSDVEARWGKENSGR